MIAIRQYKIWLHETEAGPFSYAQLVELEARGTLVAETPVRNVNAPAWSSWTEIDTQERRRSTPQLTPAAVPALESIRRKTVYPNLRTALYVWVGLSAFIAVIAWFCWMGYSSHDTDPDAIAARAECFWFAVIATASLPATAIVSFILQAILDIADATVAKIAMS